MTHDGVSSRSLPQSDHTLPLDSCRPLSVWPVNYLPGRLPLGHYRKLQRQFIAGPLDECGLPLQAAPGKEAKKIYTLRAKPGKVVIDLNLNRFQ